MNYCSECGSKLSEGAKFCHRCGRGLAGATSGGSNSPAQQAPWVWIGGGGVVLVLIAVVAIVAVQSNGGAAAPAAAPAGATNPLELPPREQADRLFDRVMSIKEQGDSTQAAFFIPMAIQAHQALPVLDADARFHIGELELLRGGIAAARAQADSVRGIAGKHLFAAMLDGGASEQEGDTAGVTQAYREFLANEQEELALGRPEYSQHQFVLNQFAEQARAEAGAQ